MGLGIKVFIDNTNKLFADELNTLVKQLDKMISFTGSRRINDNTNQLAGALDDATKRLVYHNSSTSNDTLVLIRKDVNDAIEVLEDDYVVMFYVNGSNTTAVTLKVNALPSKTLEFNGSALEPGTLKVGTLYSALYSTTTGKFSLYITGGNGGVITDPSNYKAGIVYTGDSSGLNKILLPKNLSYVGATSGNYLVTLPKITTGVFFIEILVYNNDKVDRLIVKMDSSNTGITYSSQNTVNDTIPLLAPLVTDVGVGVGATTVKVGLTVVTSSSSSLVVSSVYTMDTIDRRKVETESKFEKVATFPVFDSSFETLKNLDVSGDTRGVNGIPDSHVTGSIKHNENINSSKYDSISTSILFGGEISYIKTTWDDGRGRAIADIVYQEAFEPKAGTKAYRYGNPDGSMSAWAYTMNLLSDYTNKIATLATGYKLRISNNLSINTTATGNLNTTKALAIGDGGTGFRQNGKGVLEFYADNTRIFTLTDTALTMNEKIFISDGTTNGQAINLGQLNTRHSLEDKDKLIAIPVPLRISDFGVVSVGPVNATATSIAGAIEYLLARYSRPDISGVTATIYLNEDAVINEPLVISGLDLGWITIKEITPSTAGVSVNADNFSDNTSLFECTDGVLPVIDASFTLLPTTKTITALKVSRSKVRLAENMEFKDFTGMGVYSSSSDVTMTNAVIKNTGNEGIFATANSKILAQNASVNSCGGTYAITIDNNSNLNFGNGDCLLTVNAGLMSRNNSLIYANGTNVTSVNYSHLQYSLGKASVIHAHDITGASNSSPAFRVMTIDGIIYAN